MAIDSYEVLGRLGEGGMGVVFRGRAADGRDVAIKILRRTDAGALARFEREKRLIATLGEAYGFVPLIDSGLTPQGPYLVMPYLPGGTLRDRLEKGPLTIDATLALGRELASALAAAHEFGIIHRDVKPENILFTGDSRPLLADLGLGKHFTSDGRGASKSVSLSRSGSAAGTVGYMPQEQMRDAKAVGPAADVFSLGAVLYECLSGVPAFSGENMVELAARVDFGSVKPLAVERPEAPAWLVSVIERSLAREAPRRFRDGRELRNALVGPAPIAPAAPRRSGAVLALAIVAVVLALATMTLALSETGSSPEIPKPPAQVPKQVVPVVPVTPPRPEAPVTSLAVTDRPTRRARLGDRTQELYTGTTSAYDVSQSKDLVELRDVSLSTLLRGARFQVRRADHALIVMRGTEQPALIRTTSDVIALLDMKPANEAGARQIAHAALVLIHAAIGSTSDLAGVEETLPFRARVSRAANERVAWGTQYRLHTGQGSFVVYVLFGDTAPPGTSPVFGRGRTGPVPDTIGPLVEIYLRSRDDDR